MSGSRLPRSAARVVNDAVRRAFVDGIALSRAELADRTGLSRSALQNAVARMLDDGELVVVDGEGPRGSGRPAQLFRLGTTTPTTSVVELDPDGSTTVTAAARDDEPRPRHDALPWHDDFARWAAGLRDVLDGLAPEQGSDPSAPPPVVVSVPFPFAPGRGVLIHPPVAPPARRPGGRLPVPGWLSSDPTPELAAALGRPVQLVNDADLAGLAEVHLGAARGARTAIHLSVRDGVGAAFVVDGRVTTGAAGMTGELAHVQVVPDGPLCSCGNRGCIATQTRSPSLVTALTLRYGHDVSFDDMEALVAHDDALAVRFLTDLGRLVGGPLATVVGFLDPDVLVVDGRLGAAVGPVSRGITEVLHQRCSPAVVAATRVVPGRFTRPGPVGAAIVGDALAAGRLTDVLRVTTTPPPPVRVEEASERVG